MLEGQEKASHFQGKSSGIEVVLLCLVPSIDRILGHFANRNEVDLEISKAYLQLEQNIA